MELTDAVRPTPAPGGTLRSRSRASPPTAMTVCWRSVIPTGLEKMPDTSTNHPPTTTSQMPYPAVALKIGLGASEASRRHHDLVLVPGGFGQPVEANGDATDAVDERRDIEKRRKRLLGKPCRPAHDRQRHQR